MNTFLLQHRRAIAEAIHALTAAAALALGLWLRFDFAWLGEANGLFLASLPFLLVAKLTVFRFFELQHLGWRYVGFADLLRLGAANFAASVLATVVVRWRLGTAFPRSVYATDLVLCFTLLCAARAAIKWELDRRRSKFAMARQQSRRVLIYGAGKAGSALLAEIRAAKESFEVLGFVDDDPSKLRMQIHGLRVLGGRGQLAALVTKLSVAQVLIAIPRATGSELSTILEACHAANVEARRVPALAELMENRVLLDQIREVRLEDLLGRAPAHLNQDEIAAHLTGRVILVTGAGGSIGSELCRQIARFAPAAIVGFDQAETPLYYVEQEIDATGVAFRPEIGSIQSRRRLQEVFAAHRPHIVFHAAAYKHVPLMESHLYEAIENNIFGTANVARCAVAAGVEHFVLVSSDKAVRPTNVMGATKRLAEMVCLGANSKTRFVAVRFGNVLGSNGSVIPRFQQQIANGGPVTVTHPEMRRFFMMISEAAQLVLQASAMGQGGEIFVLDMGEPIKIVDLARKMVLLSGLRPDTDIRIVYIGVRPGEKLYEEVCTSEEDTVATPHSLIRIFTGPRRAEQEIHRFLRELRRALDARSPGEIIVCLRDAVADYNPSTQILRQALEQKISRGARRALAGDVA